MKSLFTLMLVLGLVVRAGAARASFTGYLVEQGYGFCGSPVSILSGWDVDLSGGQCVPGTPLQIVDTSDSAGVTLRRRFLRQTAGRLVWEYHFLMSRKTDGVTWQLRDGDTIAVKILTSGGSLCYEAPNGTAVALLSYSSNRDIGMKVDADLTRQKADIYIDGKLRVSGAGFRNPVSGLDAFHLYTGLSGKFTLLQRVANVHVGYLVNESFKAQAPGSPPDDWNADRRGGEVSVVSNSVSASYPDCNYARLTDTNSLAEVSLAKPLETCEGPVDFEFKFFQPMRADGFSAELRSPEGLVAAFLTQGGNLCYVATNGTPVSVWDNYRSNLWYFVRVMVDPVTGKGDVLINDIPRLTGVSLAVPSSAGVDEVRFATSVAGTGVVGVDDVEVRAAQELPADYVPEPSAVPHGPYLLGVQACNLWREGSQFGWDWISSDPERSPVLGFYDEQEIEAADWEIKFLVDHGIDFIMPCWYRPQSGAGLGPIKNGSRQGVHGYKRARYADRLRYAILVETANAPMKSLGDWSDYAVPFFVEHYFKDPRYLVVDNKPVVAFFGGIKNTGDESAARDTLRAQCVAAGFAGVTLLGCTTTGDTGFEYTYTYAKCFAAESVTNRISSPSVNWDRSAWDLPYQDAGTWRSAAEYKAQLLAQKANLPAKTGLAQTMWVLGNWNEYGEGHFLMPTEGLGFRYLDVVREVFGDGSPHVDVWPTAEQKARINVLYPQPRIIVSPSDQRAVLGTAATFDVSAVGFVPRGYQWFREGEAIPGATNASCTFGPVLPEHHGARFSVAVSNAVGRVVSSPAALHLLEYEPACKMKVAVEGCRRGGTLTNFPVLVKFSAGMTNGFAYGQVASRQANDLHFTDPTETQDYNFEIERWNTNGESAVWVQVPRVESNTWFWAHWGDLDRARTPPACWTNGATWDSTYGAVWHMKEGSGATMRDATANTNVGTLYQGVAWTNGVTGGALLFNGTTTNYVDAGKGASLSLTNRFTLSAWVCPTDYHTNAFYGLQNGFLSRGPTSAATLNYALETKTNTVITFVKRTGTEGLQFYNFTVPSLTSNWMHMALCVADGNLSLYINGKFCGAKAVGPLAAVAGSDNLFLGSVVTYRPETTFIGALDEVRILNVPQSSNEVWACWMNVASNSAFARCGAVSGGIADQDANGNGMPDVWERLYFGGTNEVNGGAGDDWDHDGVDNAGEYVAGTCPTNRASVLQIDEVAVDPVSGQVALRWPSVVDRKYGIEASTNLCLGFDRLLGSQILATPAFNWHTVHVEQTECLFFRLQVER